MQIICHLFQAHTHSHTHKMECEKVLNSFLLLHLLFVSFLKQKKFSFYNFLIGEHFSSASVIERCGGGYGYYGVAAIAGMSESSKCF